MTSALKIGVSLLALYAGYCSLLFLVQRHMLFPRAMIPEIPEAARRVKSPLESIWIQTYFGKVEAWLLKPEMPAGSQPAPLVIFAHGNAERIEHCAQELAPFTQWGIGVLLVEYPGYGRSEGTPSQASIAETFLSAYDLMTQRQDIDASKIILYGRSIGGGAICSLLKERPAAAVLLMSTFKSVRSFAPRYLVPTFLVRDPFDNLSAIRNYEGPLWIGHGKHDEVIPYAHGIALKEAAPHARFNSYDCGHNDCPPDGRIYWQDLESFLLHAGLMP